MIYSLDPVNLTNLTTGCTGSGSRKNLDDSSWEKCARMPARNLIQIYRLKLESSFQFEFRVKMRLQVTRGGVWIPLNCLKNPSLRTLDIIVFQKIKFKKNIVIIWHNFLIFNINNMSKNRLWNIKEKIQFFVILRISSQILLKFINVKYRDCRLALDFSLIFFPQDEILCLDIKTFIGIWRVENGKTNFSSYYKLYLLCKRCVSRMLNWCRPSYR